MEKKCAPKTGIYSKLIDEDISRELQTVPQKSHLLAPRVGKQRWRGSELLLANQANPNSFAWKYSDPNLIALFEAQSYGYVGLSPKRHHEWAQLFTATFSTGSRELLAFLDSIWGIEQI